MSMLQESALLFEAAESSTSISSRSTRTVEQRECHQTSAPAGFVFLFSSSVYWHSYVEAALLQLTKVFLVPLSMIRRTPAHHDAVRSQILVISTSETGSSS
ncbi:hypothetical protein GQ55_4G102300 [Panicum hallii var. hallii]|uniref:Uncharacterized protein n=1 Tax=Panicum hallii var. hallii TaxID=1504633 RepID=A0A2T7DX66_9POAL|nr:hypothetical protein GQ55_4G102300 [Panicum hallii var. hallii]PUZ60165.1 hypothetical protein GQ55_4G102300 [Panicum hallii var. hallii]